MCNIALVPACVRVNVNVCALPKRGLNLHAAKRNRREGAKFSLPTEAMRPVIHARGRRLELVPCVPEYYSHFSDSARVAPPVSDLLLRALCAMRIGCRGTPSNKHPSQILTGSNQAKCPALLQRHSEPEQVCESIAAIASNSTALAD